MKAKFFLVAVFAFALTFVMTPLSTFAQTTTTGTVEGTVSDPNGAAVPNVTVTLSGPNLVRSQTSTTDSDGAYRFSSVPPGRYSLDIAAASGFNAYKQENIEVNLSRSTSINAVLALTGTAASVDVIANPDVDQSTNVTGSNISTEFFSNIPTSRTVQGLYTIAPTVTRSGLRDASGRERDPSVAGSSGPENSYILDGINTTDPAFGGGGANLPFEFVQEVEIKTGAFGADQGLSTGGVFNVITKSGTNEFHGDVFAYGLPKSFVRETKNFPFTGLAPDGYSEIDAGVDIGGPILKNRLTFFAAFNPQFRTNSYLTQTFRNEVEGKIRTPFYSGKLSWLINNANTLTFTTFGDFTREKGHLYAQNLQIVNGFGVDEGAFQGTRDTGGHNYAARLNSNLTQNWIGEFSFGMHFQRNNVIPATSLDIPNVTDAFAILRPDNTVAPIVQTGVQGITRTGFVDFAFVPGGTLQRNFVRSAGFGLFQEQSRDRWEAAARLQNIFSDHTLKYGFEFYRNKYDIFQASTGPSNVFANTNVPPVPANNGTDLDNRTVNGFRVTNNFEVCTVRGTAVVCPLNQNITTGVQSFAAQNLLALQAAGGALPGGATSVTVGSLTADELNNNPVLVRLTTRVRDFRLNAQTKTDVFSYYFQDDWRVARNLQFNIGVRWDNQTAGDAAGNTFLKLDHFWDNLQPRLGFSWDPWSQGRTKIFANYARFIETPIPLDLNVRAGGGGSQTDKNFNVNTYSAPLNAIVATDFPTRNLGADPTPIDVGLKPQSVNEWTAGFEHQFMNNYTAGVRGIYRAQGTVIEDGSFDDGDTYFLFNPGEQLPPGPGGPNGNTEFNACLGDPATGRAPQCFGRARRFYRGLEFTFNRRFAENYAFQASYVFSSLTGNYEGLFRNDNGQADPNITSLFDLTSLLANTYGRLPNDRPHQFKFNGTYQTPWNLVVSGNFYVQSGIPFNALIPHPVYGNNEGFAVPRGTAIIPDLTSINGNGGITSAIGGSRLPTTWNLDLGFYYPIKFSEDMQLRFTADWFNVTNSQRALVLDQTQLITLGVAGTPNVPNPFFGSGAIFQYPSALRLGAKFSF